MKRLTIFSVLMFCVSLMVSATTSIGITIDNKSKDYSPPCFIVGVINENNQNVPIYLYDLPIEGIPSSEPKMLEIITLIKGEKRKHVMDTRTYGERQNVQYKNYLKVSKCNTRPHCCGLM